MSNEPAVPSKVHYVWPWFLLAAVMLGVALAVLWLLAEVRRVQKQRQYEVTPPAATNVFSAPRSA